MGDRNTSFFHASTKKRKALNKFSVLETADGSPVYTKEEITVTLENYFKNIFTPVERDNGIMESVISEAIAPRISEETNERLIKLPEAKEIKEALFSIHHGKAQGPDGFSACFFWSN